MSDVYDKAASEAPPRFEVEGLHVRVTVGYGQWSGTRLVLWGSSSARYTFGEKQIAEAVKTARYNLANQMRRAASALSLL